MNKKSIAAFGASLLASVCLAKAAPEYTRIDLGSLGGVNNQGAASVGIGMNNSGQVVGVSVLSDNTTGHAFLYSGGPLQDLGTLGGSKSIAEGINNLGDVVGMADTASGDKHAFLYSGGTMHDLGTLGGNRSTATAINDSGQIVGSSRTSTTSTVSHAFLYSNGTMHDLDTLGGSTSSAVGINNSGQVVGVSDTATAGQGHAFLYSNGSVQDLGTLGGMNSLAFGINNAGQIVGGSQITGSSTYHAFLYSGGSMHDLGTLNGDSAVATGINSSGEIVGALFGPGIIIGEKGNGNPIGAFLNVSGTMYNLNSVVVGSGVNFLAAFDINDNGQIVADGQLTNGQIHAFLLTPVPGQLLSISTRLDVLMGNEVEIAGFVIKGNANKKVLVGALGPTLARFGVPNVLPDPVLTLHHTDAQGHDTVIASNDNWRIPASNETAVQATGKAPPNDLESALVASLAPGAYTAIVTGKGAQTGNGLVEVYDLDGSASTTLSSISTRGFVQTGNDVMIAGVTSGGTGPTTVLARTLGPTLSQFGVPSVLANPKLELHDANGTLIASNDDWVNSPQKPQIQATGLAPPNNLEPAIISTLPVGNMTAVASGVNNTTGNALVEVYTLP